MPASEQQNFSQDLELGKTLGEGRVVTRTTRDAAGNVTVYYQDGATLVAGVGEEPELTPAS